MLADLLVTTPEHATHSDLLAAAAAGGGQDVKAWPTTALALADGQTKALSLALRVARNPDKLLLAVADLLEARILPGGPSCDSPRPGDGTVLKILSPGLVPLYFSRPQAPFTPAESARAHRLAELAEQTELSRRHPVTVSVLD
ncbi:hypothetical protein ASG92_24380 [Arthrobacter sp. Soil736]|uniref:hypothetical protein n=1 Tax=Arthrobacter sp. Soil736 TaxID=1736395 RepID=UPI0006F89FA2|nr:hypothetical protein [Arthrobacter sp. Soil736]KRE54836.1 hypothetical protein ASG92_24380 [Arthrobacter sp. Soil736]